MRITRQELAAMDHEERILAIDQMSQSIPARSTLLLWRDRILNALLGKERYYGSSAAYSAIRYVPLPESLYPARVYVHADRWRRPRAFWRPFRVRYRAEVVMQEPIPLAVWRRGEALEWASPDVSHKGHHGGSPEDAARTAVARIRSAVLADRRGTTALESVPFIGAHRTGGVQPQQSSSLGA